MVWTLVTGGAKRLGAEICLDLAKQGMPVLVHYKSNQAEAESVAERCRGYGVDAVAVRGDFSTTASTQQFIDNIQAEFPSIKYLINNVGNYLIKSAGETTVEEWTSLYQINLHAPFALSRALLPSLRRYRGSIINIGTAGSASFVADVRWTAYKMTKMSLLMLTKSLARELAHSQVRVNMVSPGYLENSIDLPETMPKMTMQRPAHLDEVVRVISFLLDDKNAYITGQNIEIAGGVAL